MNTAFEKSTTLVAGSEPLLLLVDDEPSIRSALKRTLRKSNYQFVEANSAEQAIVLLDQQPVSCVITDLRMPGVGGHGLVQHCHNQGTRVPIVVVSGMANRHDLDDLLRAGVSSVVEKPWSPAELREAIFKAVRQAQQQSLPRRVVSPAPDSARQIGTLTGTEIQQGDGFELPVVPTVALQSRQLARNPSTLNHAIVATIEQDPKLAGRLIQVANSRLFRGRGRARDVRSAVSRVGLDQLVQVIDSIMAQSLYQVSDASLSELASPIWRHSWARSVAMRLVVEAVESELRVESAHLMGLLCDVGIPILLEINSANGRDSCSDEACALIERQHAAVGAMVLARWLLPQPLVNFVREHHQIDSPQTSHAVLVLRVADRVCDTIGRASPHTRTRGGEQAMARLRMSRRRFDSVCALTVEHLRSSAAPFDAESCVNPAPPDLKLRR